MPSLLMLVAGGAVLVAFAAVFYAMRLSREEQPPDPEELSASEASLLPGTPAVNQPPRPIQQSWSIADDEEDAIPTSLFRPADDPEFAAFLAEERTAEGGRPRRTE